MAAGTWTFFKRGKRYAGRAAINFSANAFRISLHQSAAAPISAGTSADTLLTISGICAQLASANGYSRGGRLAAGTGFTLSNNNAVFSRAGVCWSANGGNLGNTVVLRYAVMRLSTAAKSGIPFMFVCLSANGFAVADTNALKINGGTGSTAKYFNLT